MGELVMELVMRASLTLVLATVTIGARAHAAPDDTKAQKLYDSAKADVAAGKWSDACPKLAESQKLAPKMNTVYRLAECYERTGKRASAWKRYREAAIAATHAGETSKAKAALDRAEKLSSGLPRLSIQGNGVEVRVDDEVITDASIALDPGEHVVVVTAPKKKPYRTSIVIPDNASTTALVIPALEDEAVAPAPVAKPIATLPVEPKPSGGSTTRIVGMVLAGTGIVTASVGGFIALSARSKYHDADPHCPPAGCDEVGARATEDARSMGNVATVVIGAGLAIGVTGAVLWLTSPRASEAPKVGITVLPSGLLLRGEF